MARYISLLLTLGNVVYGYDIWASPDDLPDTIPGSCINALSHNLTCSGGLIRADSLGSGRLSDVLTLSDYCQPDCLSSLQVSTREVQGEKRLTPMDQQTFKRNVDSSCGDTTYQCTPMVIFRPVLLSLIHWFGHTTPLACKMSTATQSSKCVVETRELILSQGGNLPTRHPRWQCGCMLQMCSELWCYYAR